MEMTTFQNAGVPADPSELRQRLQQARAAAPATSSGLNYMHVGQVGQSHEGLIVYGANKDEVEEDSEWAINYQGLQHGWLLRDGAQVNGEAYTSVFEPRPDPEKLQQPKPAETWKPGYKCQLVCLSGEDTGTMCEYGGDSGGVVKAFKDVVMPALERRLDDAEATAAGSLYPIVKLGVRSYHSSKQRKDIYEIVVEIVDWMTQQELQEALGSAGESPARAADADNAADDGEGAAQAAATEPAQPASSSTPQGGRSRSRRSRKTAG